MPEETTERVTKLSAARRQLRTAVRLFFEGRDTVSVHTLAAAAHEVLWSLLKRKRTGGGSIIKDSIPSLLSPENVKVYNDWMNEAQNFFKHADRDPDEELEFGPASTRLVLFDSSRMYFNLTGRHLREAFFFIVWFYFEYPDVLDAQAVPAHLKKKIKRVYSRGPVSRESCLRFINRPDLFHGPNLD